MIRRNKRPRLLDPTVLCKASVPASPVCRSSLILPTWLRKRSSGSKASWPLPAVRYAQFAALTSPSTQRLHWPVFLRGFLGYSLARSGNALIRADGHIPILSRWLSWHQGCTFDLLQLTARTVRISPHRRSVNSDLPSDRILFAIQTGRVFIIRLSRNTTTAAECVRSCSFTSWLRCFNCST